MSIHIKINGKPAEANKGEYLLDTIERQGIKIPTLCHIKGMFPSGACRMCLVELEGSGKLITSCSYPVEDGMSIFTHSPKVVEARKTIVELLLSNHPDDCLYCARNKNCELQNFADDFNIRLRKTKGNKNDYNLDIAGLSLERDPDKCVLCGRCIRICEETIGVTAIDFINRGSKTIV